MSESRRRRTHATSSPKSLIFLWQVSSRDRREDEEVLPEELPAPAPWCTGVGGAETVVLVEEATVTSATDADAEEGSRRTLTAPRAGERSIVVVEDDRLGGPPSCPTIRSRTLGRHQILHASHRTRAGKYRRCPGSHREESSAKILGEGAW